MSTIKVDTYLTRGGVSEIAIDKLKGASSASSISVVAEGGTNTTNLQQGLVKAWINLNGTGTIASRDSFNVSSIADQATGDTRVTVSSAFATTNYCTTASGGENADSYSGGMRAGSCYMVSTTVAGVAMSFQNGGASDCVINCSHITGDLA